MELFYSSDQFLLGALPPSHNPTLKTVIETHIAKLLDRAQSVRSDFARSKIAHTISDNVNLKHLNLSLITDMASTVAKLRHPHFMSTDNDCLRLLSQESK